MNRRNFLGRTGGLTLSMAAMGTQLAFAGSAFAGTRKDPLNAFVDYGPMSIQKVTEGPLAGLNFSVKDCFDVAGFPTGAGSPAWLRDHAAAKKHADAVEQLLDAGGHLAGKNHMDELAWSLMGENVHYGTPLNSAAPDRIPGGSSSGSASAVAGGAVDFALAGDTGGSVRVPASFCGIYGLRPTHGRVSKVGEVPLAGSYDTVGWFARNPHLMEKLGSVLLKEAPAAPRMKKLLIVDDQFGLAGHAMHKAVEASVERLSGMFGSVAHVNLGTFEERQGWLDIFRTMQAYEIWEAHGAWVKAANPQFGPGINGRFTAAEKVTAEQYAAAKAKRAAVTQRMADLLGDDAVMVFPTTPGVAPKLRTPEAELNTFRQKLLEMLCPAGHAGLPQLSMPVAKHEGAPVGLSIVGKKGDDMNLLAIAKAL